MIGPISITIGMCIGTDRNKILFKIFQRSKEMWVLDCWVKLAQRKKLKNLHVKSQLPSFYSFRDFSVHTDGQTDMATSTTLQEFSIAESTIS